MPGQPDAPLGEYLFPAPPGADTRRYVIQPPLLLLAGEAGELRMQRMRAGEKSFFAVQDGRVVRAGVIPVLNPKRLERHEQRGGQAPDAGRAQTAGKTGRKPVARLGGA